MNLPKKPINQHSLQSLELWLTDLGAVKDVNNPSKWYLLLSNWNATIIFEQEDLSVIWESEGQETLSGKVRDKKLKDYFHTALIEKMWKMQYCRDLKFLSKDCLRFALLSSNFFLIDHLLYREAARGK